MEEIFSSSTSVDFQQTTLSYIPENRTVNNYRSENPKSCKFLLDMSESVRNSLI
jgi:hypothetical protein